MAAANRADAPSANDIYAQIHYASLINSQWDDYQKRFQPQESNLIDQINGDGGLQTTFLPKELENANTDVNTAFDSAKGQQSRDMSRYGQAMTDDQTTAQDTVANLSQASALANANNKTIQQDQDMKNGIMSGGLGEVARMK